MCLAARPKNHQCAVHSCARCHGAHNVLLCPEDFPEKSLLGLEEPDEEVDDDLIESYLANSDPEAANVVMEEKVLLAREVGSRLYVAEGLLEDSDSGSLLERNPEEERLSESSVDSLTLPVSTGERVFISRELPEDGEGSLISYSAPGPVGALGDDEDLGSASEDEGGSLISFSLPDPVGTLGDMEELGSVV